MKRDDSQQSQPRVNLIMLGPPGAGKGTQGALLHARLGGGYYSTGEIIRAAVRGETGLGLKLREYMEANEFVPDEIISAVVNETLAAEPEGFILDGYPRTIPQAEDLTRTLEASGRELSCVILIESSDETVTERLIGRRSCPSCAAIYHVELKPPHEEGVCDECGGGLERRADDNAEAAAKRLEDYRRLTEPLISYYAERGELLRVSGEGSPSEVAASLSEIGARAC